MGAPQILRAEPMAQVLTVAAMVATAEIALPVAALTAAGTGTATLGISSATATNTAVAGELAVVGSFQSTSAFSGVAGYNVLRIPNAAYTFGGANLPWISATVAQRQTVIIRAHNEVSLTAMEIQMFMNSGYTRFANMLFPGPK